MKEVAVADQTKLKSQSEGSDPSLVQKLHETTTILVLQNRWSNHSSNDPILDSSSSFLSFSSFFIVFSLLSNCIQTQQSSDVPLICFVVYTEVKKSPFCFCSCFLAADTEDDNYWQDLMLTFLQSLRAKGQKSTTLLWSMRTFQCSCVGFVQICFWQISWTIPVAFLNRRSDIWTLSFHSLRGYFCKCKTTSVWKCALLSPYLSLCDGRLFTPPSKEIVLFWHNQPNAV